MISKHITYEEATESPTAKRHGIKNVPNEMELANMKRVAEKCFEPLREWYGKPIKINSFFRCDQLNTLVGGSKTSQHVFGQAIDMSAIDKKENAILYDWCLNNLEFDQLIWEYGDDLSPLWIHISYKKEGNRKQVLRIK